MADDASNNWNVKDGKKVNDEEFLKNLKLPEDKLNDVFMGKKDVGSWPKVKWMEVARCVLEGLVQYFHNHRNISAKLVSWRSEMPRPL